MSTAAISQFANYIENQPGCDSARAPQPQTSLIEHPPSKKPPRAVDQFFRESETSGVSSNHFNELDSAYVMEDRVTVVRFVGENHLLGLLLQARKPLNDAFTKKPVKVLSVVRDEEGFETLFCLVRIDGDMQPARQALKSFDEQWWLTHSNQVTGKLNFDFELV